MGAPEAHLKIEKQRDWRYEAMIRTAKMGFVVGLLAAGIAAGPAMAQDSMKQDSMKQDDMKHDHMKQDEMMHEESAKRLFTGKFSGKVHQTEGRATVYQQADGKLLLRLTGFKTSNGPDVHVVLLAIKDRSENANSLKSNTERVELGKLKGNEGDQNYEIPAGTDLSKFTTVSIYCERFNANFGAAPLEKF
jgi:Electron transfer DM13.